MDIPERTPVLVGIGQILNRIEDVYDALEPLEMMWQATQRRCRRLQSERKFEAGAVHPSYSRNVALSKSCLSARREDRCS